MQTVTTHVAGSAAQYNPFRYRGYYYDADPAFYNLPTVEKFGPVVSVKPGPIYVSNVLIIGRV